MAIAPRRSRRDLRGHAHPLADPDRCSSRSVAPRRRRHPPGQLRPEPSLDPRRPPPDRRPGRRERRRPARRWSATCTPASRRTWSRRRGGRRSRTRERIDYLSFQNNELAFVLAIEKLLEVEVPPKADVDADAAVRAEPRSTRTSSGWRRRARARARSRCSGTASASASASSTSSSSAAGRACTRATSRPAGSPRTSRAGSSPSAATFIERMPGAVDEYETILDRNAIWLERTKGLGPAARRRRARARAVRAGPARLRGRLGPAQDPAVPRLRRGRFPRPRLLQRRRLRPLPGAHGGDARVDAGSSRRRSTGSRTWSATRGSSTTGASCCRRATSSTPRWRA